MPIGQERLQSVVDELRRRPGHTKVAALVHELCVVGIGVPDRDLNFEIAIPEVRGRMDALLGATVFEFKSNLLRERGEAETQLTRCLSERERAAGRRYLGIATDGADFVAYQIAHDRLVKLTDIASDSADPRALRAQGMPEPDPLPYLPISRASGACLPQSLASARPAAP
jgi:hypothetical protein